MIIYSQKVYKVKLIYIIIIDMPEIATSTLNGNEEKYKSLKDMTDDEKKEHRRKKNREYMKKRMEDPEFARKQKEYCRAYSVSARRKELAKINRNEGPRAEYKHQWYLTNKEKMKNVKELENKLAELEEKLKSTSVS